MSRWCDNCNRPLTIEHHEIGPFEWQIMPLPGGKRVLRRMRSYGCKLRFTSVNPTTGKMHPAVPSSKPRSAVLDEAWRSEANLERRMKDA